MTLQPSFVKPIFPQKNPSLKDGFSTCQPAGKLRYTVFKDAPTGASQSKRGRKARVDLLISKCSFFHQKADWEMFQTKSGGCEICQVLLTQPVVYNFRDDLILRLRQAQAKIIHLRYMSSPFRSTQAIKIYKPLGLESYAKRDIKTSVSTYKLIQIFQTRSIDFAHLNEFN